MSDNMEQYMERFLPKIAKGAGIVFIGTMLGRVAGYISRLIIARGLGPEPYGLISLGIGVFSIFALVGSLGLRPGITRYVSLFKGKEDEKSIRGSIISGLKVVFPTRLVLGFLLFLFSGWISVHLFHDPDLSVVLRIMAIGVPIGAFTMVFVSALKGFQRMDYIVYSTNIAQYFGRAALIGILVLLGYGVFGVSLAYIIAIGLGGLVAFYLLQRKVLPVIDSQSPSTGKVKSLLAYSWPLMMVGIMGLITGWTDTLMLGAFKSSTEVGFYNVARPTAQLMSAIPFAFGAIFFPVLSELYGRGRKREMEDVFRTVSKWVFMGLLPIAVLMILFPSTIIRVMFGPTYTVASKALAILTIGFLLTYLFMTSRQLLQTIGRTKLVLLVSLVGASLNVLLNYLLIPPYGIEGAAIGTSLSVTAGGILAGAMAIRTTGFRLIHMNWMKIPLSGFAGVLPLYLISEFLGSPSPIPLILFSFLVFSSIYLLLLLVLGSFDWNDLTIISALERRLGMNLKPIRRAVEKFM